MAWTFGPYEMLELIGRGGMGEVYRARDSRRERLVALKLLPTGLAADPDYLARFRREQLLAARLRDPHVIPIHDFGEIDGRLFIDMRLVDGDDLGSLLHREGPLDPVRAVHLLGQAAQALHSAHEDGLVHRDVKPGNLLVTVQDFVYVVDFGIARSIGSTQTALTMTGAAVGTLDYMAPERFTLQPLDRRVDVYSLACLLHECLTGARPFLGEDLPSLMYAHLHLDAPTPSRLVPGVPPALDGVVARGMAKDPDARFPTAAEFGAAARAALGPAAAVARDAARTTVVVDAGPATAPAGPPTSASHRLPVPPPSGPQVSGPHLAAPPPPHAGPPRTPTARPAAIVIGERTAPPGSGPGPSPVARDGEPRRRRRGLLTAVVAAVVAIVLTGWLVLRPDGAAEDGAAGAGGAATASPAVDEDAASAGTAAPADPVVQVVASVPIPAAGGTIDVGATPGYAAVTPDGRFVYVANRGAGVVTVVDTTLDSVVATIPIEAGPPQFLTFSPDGSIVYVTVFNADYTVNAVAFLEVATNRVVRTVDVGRRPFAPSTNPDGSLLYVPSHEDGQVDVVDTASGELLRRVPTPPNPHWVVFDADGGRYWTADHESGVVTAFDAATDAQLAAVPTGMAPHSLAFSPDGTVLCVVNYESSTLSVIDPTTYAVVHQVDVGLRPQDVSFAPDGRYLYTANVDGDTVSVVDTSTWTVTATIPAGDGPTSVAVLPDGSRAYVTNLEEGTLRILDTGA